MLQFLPVRNTAYISLLNLLTGYVGVCLANCYNLKRFFGDVVFSDFTWSLSYKFTDD